MDLRTEELRLFASLQGIESDIELALETVDHGRVEPRKMLLVEQPIQSILSLNQKMQASLAIIDVEGEEKFDPRRQPRCVRGLVPKRFALGLLVDDAAADRPGIDDFLDSATEWRV